jgi:hypothetical protein
VSTGGRGAARFRAPKGASNHRPRRPIISTDNIGVEIASSMRVEGFKRRSLDWGKRPVEKRMKGWIDWSKGKEGAPVLDWAFGNNINSPPPFVSCGQLVGAVVSNPARYLGIFTDIHRESPFCPSINPSSAPPLIIPSPLFPSAPMAAPASK